MSYIYIYIYSPLRMIRSHTMKFLYRYHVVHTDIRDYTACGTKSLDDLMSTCVVVIILYLAIYYIIYHMYIYYIIFIVITRRSGIRRRLSYILV